MRLYLLANGSSLDWDSEEDYVVRSASRSTVIILVYSDAITVSNDLPLFRCRVIIENFRCAEW